MPKQLLEQLDRTARRDRRDRTLTACAWVLAALVGVATLLVFVDAMGRFSDPGLRWLFTGVLVAAVAAVAWRVRSQLHDQPATRLSIAEKMQQQRPELGSRLASAVEFVESESSGSEAGSEELRRAVVIDAATSAEGLDFCETLDRRPLQLAGRALAGAVAAVVVFGVVDSSSLATGIARLAAPWSQRAWPRLTELSLKEPVTVLARGDAFEAIAVNAKGAAPDDTRIEYRFEDGSFESAPMQPVGDQAVARRERVDRSFAYRAVGGDDQTMDWIELSVIDPPALESLKIATDPPAYSGLSASETSGSVRVLAGTGLRLRGVVNEALSAASLVLSEDQRIDLTIDTEEETGAVQLNADWLAVLPATKGTYELELTGASGVIGKSKARPYEVIKDEPPKVTWGKPEGGGFAGDTLVVTPRAVIPIIAEAADNLAIASARLEWSFGGERANEEPQGEPLFEGGANPPHRKSLDDSDKLAIRHEWDLSQLELEVDEELRIEIVASDYQPAEGRTRAARTLLLVTDEELDSRLAEQQSRLLADVQRALDEQRGARETTRDLRVDTAQSPPGRQELDRLSSLEFAQRRSAEVLTDPNAGAVSQARRLVEQIERNRLERPELAGQLNAVREALSGLAEAEQPEAQRELASARRAGARAESDPEAQQRFDRALGEAERLQTASVERLEQVAESLAGWSDYQRFATELTELEQKQRELSEEAAKRVAELAGDPLKATKLRAAKEKLLGSQSEIARRFSKLDDAMRRLLDSSDGASPPPKRAVDSVEDALAESEERNVSGSLRDAARDLALGRLGSAAGYQDTAAEGMREMLDALRRRATNDPQELIKQLQEQQERLARLQQQVDDMQQRGARAAERADAAQEGQRIGRRLDRLTAPDAGASASQGAQSMSDGQQGQQGQQGQLAQAQESFDQAQQQIEQRIKELQDELTQRLLDRLAGEIEDYLRRQSRVVRGTELLDARLEADGANSAAIVERGARLMADEQAILEDEVRGFAVELAKRAVFELALRGAADEMLSAAERLERIEVGRVTQRRTKAALRRLKQIAEVLKQNQDLNEQQQEGGQGQGGQPGEPPPPSPIDVAELKMLRVMQLEVLAETDILESDIAAATRSGNRLPADARESAKRLSQEQTRLAELALELAERNNDPEASESDP